MIFLQLFWSFFQIGLFSIGGGYAALPLIKEQIVELNQWLTQAEYNDIITISQMTPGPISINAATFVGTKIGGALGAVIATVGFVMPSVIIISILYAVYKRYRKLSALGSVLAGLRPAVVGLIASAGVAMVISSFFKDGTVAFRTDNMDFFAIIVFAACFYTIWKHKVNPILVISAAGVAGGVFYSVF
ncbi:MAG: chromate transporter [Eubacteriales bacterium]|nr:chromate transporter [Eubacteriales bacterium]MDD4422473.1 chromate transporter [Eubacteriales bacterium]